MQHTSHGECDNQEIFASQVLASFCLPDDISSRDECVHKLEYFLSQSYIFRNPE